MKQIYRISKLNFIFLLMISMTGAVWFPAHATNVTGYVQLSSDPVGGAIHSFETGWALLITKYSKLVPTVMATSGGREQTRLLADGKTDIAVASNVILGEVLVLGKETFLKREQVMPIRMLFNTGPYFEQIVTLEKTGIKNIRELRGKRISLGPAGSNGEKWMKIILEEHGVTDYRPTNMNYSESIEALKNGDVSAIAMLQSSPISILEELSLRHPFRFLSVDSSLMDKMISKAGGSYAAKINPNIYKKQINKDAIDALGLAVPLGSPVKFDEDKVYSVVKILFEHLGEFAQTSAFAASFAKNYQEFMLEGLLLPLHKGAIKYYREKGIKVPEKLIPPEAK